MNTKRLLLALRPTAIVLLTAIVFLSGCGGGASGGGASDEGIRGPTPAVQASTPPLQGVVHGGQAPIAGSSITLYAAGTPAAAAAAQLATATTDATGSFSISGFTCPSDSALLYVVAAGGNAGGGANGAIKLMAAVGPCSSRPSFVNVNELTTAAAVYALNAFSEAAASPAGSFNGCADCTPARPSDMTSLHGDLPAIANAFGTAALLADVSTGDPASSLPSSVSCLAGTAGAPVNCSAVQKLTALANALAACVNSAGATSSQCTELFACAVAGALFDGGNHSCAVPDGAVTAADTLSATLNIARSPGLVSVAGIYDTATRNVVFAPGLAAAPTDWTIALQFTGGGLAMPDGIAIDGVGDVWVANFGPPGGGSVTELNRRYRRGRRWQHLGQQCS
jgi:hypothetical protein